MVHYMDIVGVSALAESIIKTAECQKQTVRAHQQQEDAHRAHTVAALGGNNGAPILKDTGIP